MSNDNNPNHKDSTHKYEVTLKYYSYSPSGDLEVIRTEIENFFVDLFNGDVISVEVKMHG